MNNNLKIKLENIPGFEITDTDGEFSISYNNIVFIYGRNLKEEDIWYAFEKDALNKHQKSKEEWIKENTKEDPIVKIEIVKNRIRNLNILGSPIFSLNWNKTHLSNLYYGYYIFFGIEENIALSIIDDLESNGFIKTMHHNQNPPWYNYFLPISSLLKTDEKTIFIISEFNDKNKSINQSLKERLKENGFNPILMNEDHKFGNIDLAIKKYIKESKYIIANLSYKNHWNANVFYELGLANAFDKDIFMFISEEQFPDKDNNQLPFDINSHTCLKWQKGKENEMIEEILKTIK